MIMVTVMAFHTDVFMDICSDTFCLMKIVYVGRLGAREPFFNRGGVKVKSHLLSCNVIC